jgi:hypothetical protein
VSAQRPVLFARAPSGIHRLRDELTELRSAYPLSASAFTLSHKGLGASGGTMLLFAAGIFKLSNAPLCAGSPAGGA